MFSMFANLLESNASSTASARRIHPMRGCFKSPWPHRPWNPQSGSISSPKYMTYSFISDQTKKKALYTVYHFIIFHLYNISFSGKISRKILSRGPSPSHQAHGDENAHQGEEARVGFGVLTFRATQGRTSTQPPGDFFCGKANFNQFHVYLQGGAP